MTRCLKVEHKNVMLVSKDINDLLPQLPLSTIITA
jgi:hypothetical protein